MLPFMEAFPRVMENQFPRPVAVGRNNDLFAGSDQGARNAAVQYVGIGYLCPGGGRAGRVPHGCPDPDRGWLAVFPYPENSCPMPGWPSIAPEASRPAWSLRTAPGSRARTRPGIHPFPRPVRHKGLPVSLVETPVTPEKPPSPGPVSLRLPIRLVLPAPSCRIPRSP